MLFPGLVPGGRSHKPPSRVKKNNSYGQKNSIYVLNLYLLGVGEMLHWVKSFLLKQRELTSGSHGTHLLLSLWGGGASLTHWLVIWEDPGQGRDPLSIR